MVNNIWASIRNDKHHNHNANGPTKNESKKEKKEKNKMRLQEKLNHIYENWTDNSIEQHSLEVPFQFLSNSCHQGLFEMSIPE